MREVPLVNSSNVCLVDDEDYALMLSAYKWREAKGYAYTNIKYQGKTEIVMMHRMIMNLQPNDGLQVDHLYHNTLDNRKSQLRVCTPLQNTHNRR